MSKATDTSKKPNAVHEPSAAVERTGGDRWFFATASH